jgi:arylsulfatase A-like enzyme
VWKKRAARVVTAVFTATLIAACHSSHSGERRPSPPYNVLLISIDTVRQDVLSCYGHRARRAPGVPTTPNLDAFAAMGVRMVDAYASSSWTLPSHLSMMTGQTPLVHGVDIDQQALAGPEPTLAEILRGHGYRTRGVFSGPYLDPTWGFGRGYERYRGVYGGHTNAAIERFARDEANVEADMGRAMAGADHDGLESSVRTRRMIRGALDREWTRDVSSNEVTAAVLEDLRELSVQDHPWLLFAHYFDAHEDYVPPPPFETRFDPDYTGPVTGKHVLGNPLLRTRAPGNGGRLVRRASDRDLEHVIALYEGEVAWVDDHLGKVLRELDARGVADRTLVIVVSDHGEEFFEHGGLGHRHTLFEESLRVPMLLRLPGVLPSGRTVRGVVSVADLLPTILDILGLSELSGWVGSTSFVPLMEGREDGSRRTIFARHVTFANGIAEIGSLTIPAREVTVSETFRRGSIKVTRTRRWPQFATAPQDVVPVLEAEAEAQYGHEDLRWIDAQRFPSEPADAHSVEFGDATVRAVLDAFRDEYARSARLRRHIARPQVAPQIQSALRALGYVEGDADPEPDRNAFVLPPPGG